jgi:hypothetical protein
LHYELRRSVAAPKTPELLAGVGSEIVMRDPEELPDVPG